MTKKDALIFLNSFLWGGITAYGLLFFIVILSGSPQQKNQEFLQSMATWARPAYVATYDFRHYATGLVLFATLPVLFFLIATRFSFFSHFIQKIPVIASLSTLLTAITWRGFPLLHQHLSSFLSFLLTTPRGQQTLDNLALVFLLLLIWILIYIRMVMPGYALSTIKSPTWLRLRMKTQIPIYYHLLFLALFVFLVWNSGYAFSFISLARYGNEINSQFHHFTSYVGPINDVLHGKILLVNATAQYYGYLATYFPAAFFYFIGLSFTGFSLYMNTIAAAYVIGVYFFLLLVTKRWYWALSGTLLYIKLNFFRSFWPEEIYMFPSITPLRYWPDILIFTSIAWQERSRSFIWSATTSFLVVFALFYNLEIGLSLFAAYIGMLLGDFLFRRNTKELLISSISLLATLAGLTGIITIITYLFSHHWPDFTRLAIIFFYFGKGYSDLPMPIMDAYYVPLSIYFVSYGIIIFLYWKHSYYHVRLYLFLLLYGLCSFVYYLGLSEPNHLFTVIHPALFLALFFTQRFYPFRKMFDQIPRSTRSILLTYGVIVLCFFLWRPWQFIQDLQNRLQERYNVNRSQFHYWPYPGTHFYLLDNDGATFAQAAHSIQTYAKGNEALILSRYDTLLSIMSGKTSPLPYSYIEYGILYKKDLQLSINLLRDHPPSYVFVARNPYTQAQTDTVATLWKGIQDHYAFLESAGAVDVYRWRQ